MVFFCIISALALVILLGSFVVYELAFAPRRIVKEDFFSALPKGEQYAPHKEEMEQLLRAVLELPYEDVWIETEDGLRLHGKYYHTATGAPVQIMFHGYRSFAELDVCGALPLAQENGYNVLVVDQRGHGQSEGRCITLGIRECEDCAEWVDYVLYRFGKDVRITLFGLSMGAATVLLAAGLDLPQNVECVIADSGYTSPRQILCSVIRSRHLPVWLLYPFACIAARIYGGFRLGDGSVKQAMRRCTIPVLFIHGEEDRFVPCSMSRRNFRDCRAEGRQLLLVPHAGHGLSYLTDREQYRETVRAFWNEQRTCLRQ